MLRPHSVAVIGGGWAAAAAQSCLRLGYRGALWAVHPKHKSVQGLKGVRCFRSVDDLPSPPDAAFVGVNRSATIGIVRALSAMGAGGAVCFASGFGESGDGKGLQNKLLHAAGAMPVLGPNCYGFINYLDGAALWPDIHGGIRNNKGAALICQSSNIAINLTMQKRALPMGYVICIGNQMQTDAATIGAALLKDKRISAMGLYLESIKCASFFADFAAKARRAGVGIVALKTGRSKQSRLAAAAHTAALSGGSVVSSAFLRKCRVAEVSSLPQLMEALKLLHQKSAPKGKSLCAMSCSGGEAGLVADAAERCGLTMPQPSARQKRELKKHLGPLVRIANPLDYHTFIWGDGASCERTFSLMLSGGHHLNILVLDYPRAECGNRRGWDIAASAFCRAAKRANAPSSILATLPENMPEDDARLLMRKGIVPLVGIDDALPAAAALAAVGGGNDNDNNWRPLVTVPVGNTLMLDEYRAKLMLKDAGINIPGGMHAATAKAAAEVAKILLAKGAAKVALKGLGYAHKAANNALRLNLSSAREVQQAAEVINSRGGFLVEEMINTNGAAELLISARRDTIYGATLTMAIGGAMAEVINRSITLILPANGKEIRAALEVLTKTGGIGNINAATKNAATKAAATLAKMLIQNDNLTEMEINPLLLLPNGAAVAADALATIRKEKAQ